MKCWLFTALLLIVACKGKKQDVSGDIQTGVQVATEHTAAKEDENGAWDDEERLADWFPERDSINHNLVDIAEVIWHCGKGNDSIAAVVFNNVFSNERRGWCRKCGRTLVQCFDSIHPNVQIDIEKKADLMLDEIEMFFKEDDRVTTWDMIRNLNLQNSFLLYRITAKSMQIEELDKDFSAEIKAWEVLQQALENFCVSAIRANWYGGSGIGPASLAAYNSIYEIRLNDLKRIHRQGRQNGSGSSAELNMARDKFRKVTEALAMSITKPNEKEYYDDEILAEYNEIYQEMQVSKPKLFTTLNQWIAIRSRYADSTVSTIENLTETIRELMEVH